MLFREMKLLLSGLAIMFLGGAFVMWWTWTVIKERD